MNQTVVGGCDEKEPEDRARRTKVGMAALRPASVSRLGGPMTPDPTLHSSFTRPPKADGLFSFSARRFGVKAAPVPLRSLSSPPPPAVPLTPR